MKLFARFHRRPRARNRRRNLRCEFLETRRVLAAIAGVAFSDAVVDDQVFTAGEGQSGLTVLATNERSGQQFTAVTNGLGQYRLPVPAGAYTIIASGSSLANDIVHTDVSVGATDITLDLDTSEPGQFVRTMADPWIPNPLHGSTFRSALDGGTGFWDDPASWSTNRVPAANDRIIVQAGDEIVVRNTGAIAHHVGVYHGGKLSFQTNVDTELKLVTLMVLGELEIGTAATPVAANVSANVTFRDVAIDVNADPGQFGNGLLALNAAKVTMHGATMDETFVRLAREPRAGDRTLTLSQMPSGWKAGDEILLPDTRHLRWNQLARDGNYVAEWEELTIAAVNGNRITLSDPLRFDHLGARDADGRLDFLPHVVNRTRNIVLESENPNGTRGHTLFQGRSDIDVRYAAFRHLGRTKNVPVNNTTWDAYGNATYIGANQIARYAIHAHHLVGRMTPQANGYQYTFIGNSVDNGSASHDNKWAIAIHGSHYGLIQQNTAYNIAGAAIVTEDGSESFNVIEDNFVMRSYSVGSGWRYSVEANNFHSGREATGFWFRGPNNYVRGNVATNVLTHDQVESAYGFKFLFTFAGTKMIPATQGAMPVVNGVPMEINAQAILEFSDNEVYGATEGGLTYWWVGMVNNTVQDVSSRSVIKDLSVWHTYNRGIYAYHSNQVTIDGFVVRGDEPSGSAFGAIAYETFDYPQKASELRNLDIQSMRTGIRLSTHPWDTVIENAILRNDQQNIVVNTPRSCCGFIGQLPARAEIRNVRYGPSAGRSSTAPTITMDYNPGGNLMQLNEALVYDHNGVPGDDFQLYYAEQSPDFVVPKSTTVLIAAPVAGMTNQETWDTYGIAVAGAVSPTSQTRSGIRGLVGPIVSGIGQAPVAVPDFHSINSKTQTTISGNVLINDTDANGDTLNVTAVGGPAGGVGANTPGTYGTLVLKATGGYAYTLDRDNPTVQALASGGTLTDSFRYTVSDGVSSRSAGLTLTIQAARTNSGQNPNPDLPSPNFESVDDVVFIAAQAPSNVVNGNVMLNDTGPINDSFFVKQVFGAGANVGRNLVGSYGTARINRDGSFTYTLNASNPAVSALNPQDKLEDRFAYTTNVGHAAELIITIFGGDGTQPVVLASDDFRALSENTALVSGNVLDNDWGSPLSVTQAGTETGAGLNLAGSYGNIQFDVDGSFSYWLSSTHPEVEALNDNETLLENFSYIVTDGDSSATATLSITIQGITDQQGGVLEATAILEENSGMTTGNALTQLADPNGVSVVAVQGQTNLVGQTVQGLYGTLTVNANGNFAYQVDSEHPDVDALRESDVLIDSFTFAVSRRGQAWTHGILELTILGVSDRIIGDSNGDGVFNSADLVLVFQTNEYEDDIDGNSTFADGDWNGDGDFDSSDLVLAMQIGGYEVGARRAEVDAVDQVFERL